MEHAREPHNDQRGDSECGGAERAAGNRVHRLSVGSRALVVRREVRGRDVAWAVGEPDLLVNGSPLGDLLGEPTEGLEGIWLQYSEDPADDFPWGEGGGSVAARVLVSGQDGRGYPGERLPLFTCWCGDENDHNVGMRVTRTSQWVTWNEPAEGIAEWDREPGGPEVDAFDGPAWRFDPTQYREALAELRQAVIQSRPGYEPPPRSRRGRDWRRGRSISQRWRAHAQLMPDRGWDELGDALAREDPLLLGRHGTLRRETFDEVTRSLAASLRWSDFCADPQRWLAAWVRGVWRGEWDEAALGRVVDRLRAAGRAR